MHYKKKENLLGVLMLLPSLLALCALIIYPFYFAMKLSLHSQLIYELDGHFIGLKNYIETFKDPNFWHAAWLSAIWVVATVGGQMLLGIIIALFLNEEFKGRGLARALILLPFFMPMISVSLTWRWLLNENYGIINAVLQGLHLVDNPVSWLGSFSRALMVVLFIGIWKYYAFVVINVLAGLQTVPKELYESAQMDGANFFEQFRYITMPAIREIVSVIVLLRLIFMFKKFDEIFMLTGGGPGVSTTTLPLYAYKYAFTGMELGRGSAISLIVAVLVTILIVAYMRLMKSRRSVGME